MTLYRKIELAIVGVILASAGLGAHEWIGQHDARIRAEASVEAQKQLQADYQRQVSDLAKAMSERDAAYQQQVQSIQGRFQSAITAQQVAQVVSQAMGLKAGVTISTPAATAQNPNPQPLAQISAIDFPQAKAYVEECEVCKTQNAKLVADATDRQAQAALAQKQIDSLKKSNASLETAVKGGTWIHRVGKATKYIVLGAAGGVVIGAVAARH